MADPRRARFGPFDLDLETGELRRDGAPVKLAAQPAQVLCALVEAKGELVTREALRDKIWGDGVHVDFDRGLNYCISQIRAALGDSTESPLFIATLPKRGYQFIAPLATPTQPPGRRRWLVPIAASCAAIGAGLLWLKPNPLRVAITRFDNETGDASLDRFADNVTDAFTAQLTTETTGRAGVIGNAAILRRPRAERDLRQIAASLGTRYVILGQVQKRNQQTTVVAHLIGLPEQTHVKVVRIPVGDAVQNGETLARDLAPFIV